MDNTIKVILITQAVAVFFFMAKEIYGSFKDNRKENTSALLQNTIAVTKLQVEVTSLQARLQEEFPSIKKDIQEMRTEFVEAREQMKVYRMEFQELNATAKKKSGGTKRVAVTG
jgi:chromosome segregation ATPase